MYGREELTEKPRSRVGRKPIPVPDGVEIDILANGVTVKGPKGTLTQTYHPEVKVRISDDNEIIVERLSDRKFHHALHGLTRSLISNAIIGVTDGYTKTLELMGVGYRGQQEGSGITLSVGYSHTVDIQPLDGITLEVEGTNRIFVRGIDKQKVGQQASLIRKVRRPNAYKEKGIRYSDEILRYKPGKAAARTA